MENINLENLKFCEWGRRFFQTHLTKTRWGNSVLGNNALFLDFCKVRFVPSHNFWQPFFSFFIRYPQKAYIWHNLSPLYYNDVEATLVNAFSYTFGMWYWLPYCFPDLYYYSTISTLPIKPCFDEHMFSYIDFWTETFLLFSDFLNHLLVNSTPFNEPCPSFSATREELLWIWMLPPLNFPENYDFKAHAENYYFSDDKNPYFLSMMSYYLENRPLLKEKCLNAWTADKKLNKSIPEDLTKYFVSHYLLKNLSRPTLCFLVTNMSLSEINPVKFTQETWKKKWSSYSLEDKSFQIKQYENLILLVQKKYGLIIPPK